MTGHVPFPRWNRFAECNVAAAVGELSRNPHADQLCFGLSVLAEVFDALIDGLHSGMEEWGWMR